MDKKIAIIGAGSWGTALSIMLSRDNQNIWLWGHRSSHIATLQRENENRRYLPGAIFPANLNITESLRKALEAAELVIMVVPSQSVRAVFRSCRDYLDDQAKVISAIKGIENNTLKTVVQILEEEMKEQKIECGVLSGPSFATEVAKGLPTAVTVGFKNIQTAKRVQNLFISENFRVYASSDVIGLEISAALKNIIAIAAGISDGLGFGHNTRAALITRGLAEIKRLGIALGAEESTFYGLSGVGDLVLTCTGDLSRNRSVGLMLGKGLSIKEVEKEMNMVAEGIKTTRSVYDLAHKLKIDMPILEQVYKIIYEEKSSLQAVKDLMGRNLKQE